MPLHRDIHWLGRQWAVTGHGLQLINQKQMGYYDIEIARMWEPGVIEAMQSKAWIDRLDFDKAVEVALSKYAHAAPAGAPPPLIPAASPPPPAVSPPVKRAAVEPPPASTPTIEELLAKLKVRSAPKPADVPKAEQPKLESSKPESPKPEPATFAAPQPESPKPEPPKPEPAKPEPAKPEPSQAAPIQPEPMKPVTQPPAAAPVQAANPVPAARSKPNWPVFDCKIAGSGRFIRPWRARLTL